MKCENIKCSKEHDGSYGSGRFCCLSCANTRYRSDETKRKISKTLGGKGILKEKENFCLYCGNILSLKSYKYCCKNCQMVYQYLIFINKWILKLENGVSGKAGISTYIRKYLFKKYNNKCQICGWGKIHPITGKIPLSIHHIDGNCLNNFEENLQLLCPNCHALTDNYGSLNTNNILNRNERIERKAM